MTVESNSPFIIYSRVLNEMIVELNFDNFVLSGTRERRLARCC